MRIGVDIDGVLTNREQFQIDYGIRYCVENGIEYDVDLSKYNVDGIFGLDKAQYEDFWGRYLELYARDEKARPFASEVLRKLKDKGHEIFIITARWTTERDDSEGEKMRNIVREWLRQNEIVYDELIFSAEDKMELCVENKIDLMIEDEPRCVKSVSARISVICFDAEYNRECVGENITRCYSWYDIYEKIRRIDEVSEI